MRKLAIVFFCVVACAGGVVTVSGTELCQTFIDKNKECQTVIRGVCETSVRAKLEEQILAMPAEFQAEMRADLDTKLDQFCTSFITQITGEKGLEACRDSVSSPDPEKQAQTKKMEICVAKDSCQDYADCALQFN